MATAIDVGSAGASNFDSYANGTNTTFVDLGNTANATGYITQVSTQFYWIAASVRFGIYYLSSGSFYCRTYTADLGTFNYGSAITVNGLALYVVAGDYISVYGNPVYCEMNTTDGSGVAYGSGLGGTCNTLWGGCAGLAYKLSLSGGGTTLPAGATNFNATENSSTQVTCTWTGSDATHYALYRSGVQITTITAPTVSYADTGAPAPTITPGSVVASDGTSTAHVALSISGASSNNGTPSTYYVKSYIYSNGTWLAGGNSGTNVGQRIASALSYSWYRSSSTTNDNFSALGVTTSTYNDTGAPAPTITPGTAAASDGTSTAYVALSISGQSANVGAVRWYGCAINATGATGQWAVNNDGYRGVGALYYQWQRDDSGYVNIGSNTTTSTYNDTGAPAPTITGGTAAASDGTSTAHVALSISGQSTSVGATKTYRCYLTASGASAVTSATDTGYRAAGTLTYQWQRSAADSDADYSNLTGATSTTYNDQSIPYPEARYYRCYLTASPATAQYSAVNRGYIPYIPRIIFL